MCQTKEEDYLPGLKIAWIDQCEDSKITLKKNKGLITAASNKSDNIRKKQKVENRNRQKNNCMDISSDKQVKSLARRPGHDSEKETFTKKLNFF